MNNRIRAAIQFYYQGEKVAAYLELDLDKILQTNDDLENLYPQLAATIELDRYSYQYEMMLSESIQFDQATGLARDFLQQNQFDFNAFKQAWFEAVSFEKIEKLAQQYLQITDLNSEPKIKQALLASYQLGLKDKTG